MKKELATLVAEQTCFVNCMAAKHFKVSEKIPIFAIFQS